VNGDDLLTADEVAEALGVEVAWVEARAFRLPAEVTLRDRSMRVRRRDLPAWHEAAAAERVERRPAARSAPERLTPSEVEALQRARATAARYGEPSRHQ
jgi:hypothetical protein